MPRLVAMHRAGVINVRAQKKLVEAGIHTVEDLLWLTSGGCASVVERAGMTEGELKEVLTCITRRFAPIPRQANDVFQEWKRKDCILATGCQALDHLLSGGVFTSEMIELAGPTASGKTQICLSLASSVARDLEGTVAYLDSSHSLCPLRLQTLCARGREGGGEEEEQGGVELQALAAMNRIRRYNVTDAESLLRHLSELEQHLTAASLPPSSTATSTFYRKLKLVVVDSVGSIFSSIVGGQSAHGQALLVAASASMQRLASAHHLAVIVTNHTTSRSGQAASHALGETWTHLPSVSITLSRVSEGVCRAAVRKSNKSSAMHASNFALASAGVVDVDDGPD